MKPLFKWTITLLVLGAAAGIVAIPFARSGDRQPRNQSIAYKEVSVQRGPFRLVVSASGLVRPIDRIELKSKASGEIVLLTVEIGDLVSRGELIVQLDQGIVESKVSGSQTIYPKPLDIPSPLGFYEFCISFCQFSK